VESLTPGMAGTFAVKLAERPAGMPPATYAIPLATTLPAPFSACAVTYTSWASRRASLYTVPVTMFGPDAGCWRVNVTRKFSCARPDVASAAHMTASTTATVRRGRVPTRCRGGTAGDMAPATIDVDAAVVKRARAAAAQD